MRRMNILLTALLVGGITGCGGNSQHYSSPIAQGDSGRINLDAVQEAFWQTKGSNFDSWMNSFEKRVNEIYQGDEVLSIDAGREGNRLTVTGFVDKNKKQGFQSDDDKVFAIAQTGDVRNDSMPYRMEGANGQSYYNGHHSILGNPLVQMFILSHLMRPRYFTPPERISTLDRHRGLFRKSPGYAAQKKKNFSFFKTKSDAGLKSSNGFKSFGEGRKKRTWFGSKKSTSGSSWGGRRSRSNSSHSSGGGRRRR